MWILSSEANKNNQKYFDALQCSWPFCPLGRAGSQGWPVYVALGWNTQQNISSHHIWAGKSNLFAFVSVFHFFTHYVLFLQANPLQFLSLVSKSVWTITDYGILPMSAHSSFWSWDCGKCRENRHASINTRACHCSKSSWVRLSEENIMKTIPVIGPFSFWFLSEFSLQCLPPAYTWGFFLCTKVKHKTLRPQLLWEKRVMSKG